MKFTYSSDFPRSGGGIYAHYEHLPPPSAAWQDCDARGIIQQHQQAWLDDFDAWHAALCREAVARSEWFWTSSASRPNLWAQSGSLKPLFFAAAVSEWIGAHPAVDGITVAGAPPEVATYLREFGAAPAIEPTGTASRSALLEGLRSFAAQWRLLPRHIGRRSAVKRASTLIYSHLFFPVHGTGDHFFGSILDDIAAALGDDVQAAYYIDGKATLAEASEPLGKRRVHSSLLLDGLTAGDLVAIASTVGRLWLSMRGLAAHIPPVKIGTHVSRAFGAKYLERELWAQPPVKEIAIQRAFVRALEASQARTVVYPYEEKGFERAVLSAAQSRRPPVRTVAYAHPAHTTAHLALRSRRPPEVTPPSPDVIMTAGPMETQFFVDWGRKPAQQVVTLGSHRHRGPLPPRQDVGARRGRLRVLMITGHGFELSVLATLVAGRPGLFADDDVKIRRTGGGWFAAQDEGIRRLQQLSSRIEVGGGGLFEQIEWCDVALFSSTTAGIETMLAGRLALYVALHDVFAADPLLGADGAFARCENADELATALARARSLNDVEYDAAVSRQREFASRILAPVDRARLVTALDPTRAAAAGTTTDSRFAVRA